MKRNKSRNIGTWLVMLMLLSTYPYVFNILLGLPEDKIVWVAFFVLTFAIWMVTKGPKVSATIIVCMLVQAVTWLFYVLIHDDYSYFTRIFFIIFTFLLISLLVKKNEVLAFAKLNSYLYAIQASLGVLTFVLVFLNILYAIDIIQVSGNRFLSWFVLSCSNSVYGNFIRVSGYLDEPGALASWGIFALIINKLLLDNRKIEITLIVTLLFTFSAAYFILLPLYLLGFYTSKAKRMIPMILGVAIVAYFGFMFLGSNSAFQELTLDRFSGGTVESKRTEYAKQAKLYFESNKLFGVGAQKMEKLQKSADNPYEILAKDGIVGYMVTYLPLFIVLLKYRNKETLVSVLLLFACYMQRPFHLNMMHFFMLYYIIVVIEFKNNHYPLNK